MIRALAAVVIGCAIASSALAQQVASLPPTSSTTAIIPADYPIGPQDTLVVDVFGVPELSQTVQVDTSGYIVLPLLGRIRASGHTSSDLAHEIAEQLDNRYVKNPIVSVTVKDAASQKVTVDGSVTSPGVYEIAPHTTLTEAVALAKGPDQVADVHHVAIVRNGPGGRVVKVYDLDDIHDGKVTDPLVRANDEVVVDSSGMRKFVRDFGSAFSLLYLVH